MADNTKVPSTSSNPAKSITPPTLPAKSTRGDSKSTPIASTRGKGK